MKENWPCNLFNSAIHSTLKMHVLGAQEVMVINIIFNAS